MGGAPGENRPHAQVHSALGNEPRYGLVDRRIRAEPKTDTVSCHGAPLRNQEVVGSSPTSSTDLRVGDPPPGTRQRGRPGLVGGRHGAGVVAGQVGRERRTGGDVRPIPLPLIGEAGRGPEQERREQVGRPRPVLAGEFPPDLGSAGDRRALGAQRRLQQRGEERCALAAEQGRDRPRAVEVPDPDPRAGRPAGPVNLVRRWVDRRPARARAVEQRLWGADGAAPQGPDPDRSERGWSSRSCRPPGRPRPRSGCPRRQTGSAGCPSRPGSRPEPRRRTGSSSRSCCSRGRSPPRSGRFRPGL